MKESRTVPDDAVLQPQLVTDDAELRRLCEHWRTLPVLAMDTEFIRVDTFYPQLGLLQVCDGQGSYLLDPLALTDWSSFRALLENEEIVKVLHACSEDLLVFGEYFDVMPAPVFDTQKAAAFLDTEYSISYQNLVRQWLDIEVDKGETRSDWLRRPLSRRQLHYAALDVAYLPAIYATMNERLTALGRLEPLFEEGRRMLELARQTEDPDDWDTLYLSLGGAWQLDREQLAVLRALVRWREAEARRLNLPRPWVARDNDLLLLARRSPGDARSLRDRQKELGSAARRVDDDVWLRLIREGHQQPVPEEAVVSGQPLDARQRKQLKRCQAAVREIAGKQHLAVELLARKKQLIALLERMETGNPEWPPELGGWRRALLEPVLTPLLTTDCHE